MKESEVLRRATTAFPPCCIRIFRNKWVIVGTYELEKEFGIRTGSVDMYNENLELLQSIKTYGAVLDLKLSPFDDSVIATAHSTGNVTLWNICEENGKAQIKELNNIQVFDPDCLLTSLHFSPLSANIILITTTQGDLATIDLVCGNVVFNAKNISNKLKELPVEEFNIQGNTVSALNYLNARKSEFSFSHSLECWTGEFGNLSPLENVVFTGGDDSTIAAHDIRSGDNIWSNNRIHQAGVVAIKASTDSFRQSRTTSLVTGSYDDTIRLFDLRMWDEQSIFPGTNINILNKQEQNLGGGVWRFSEAPKINHDSSDRLLVCCMYDGAKIVRVEDDNFVVEQFLKKGHESMCYGGDWANNFIATCSFYDKSLQIWKE